MSKASSAIRYTTTTVRHRQNERYSHQSRTNSFNKKRCPKKKSHINSNMQMKNPVPISTIDQQNYPIHSGSQMGRGISTTGRCVTVVIIFALITTTVASPPLIHAGDEKSINERSLKETSARNPLYPRHSTNGDGQFNQGIRQAKPDHYSAHYNPKFPRKSQKYVTPVSSSYSTTTKPSTSTTTKPSTSTTTKPSTSTTTKPSKSIITANRYFILQNMPNFAPAYKSDICNIARNSFDTCNRFESQAHAASNILNTGEANLNGVFSNISSSQNGIIKNIKKTNNNTLEISEIYLDTLYNYTTTIVEEEIKFTHKKTLPIKKTISAQYDIMKNDAYNLKNRTIEVWDISVSISDGIKADLNDTRNNLSNMQRNITDTLIANIHSKNETTISMIRETGERIRSATEEEILNTVGPIVEKLNQTLNSTYNIVIKGEEKIDEVKNALEVVSKHNISGLPEVIRSNNIKEKIENITMKHSIPQEEGQIFEIISFVVPFLSALIPFTIHCLTKSKELQTILKKKKYEKQLRDLILKTYGTKSHQDACETIRKRKQIGISEAILIRSRENIKRSEDMLDRCYKLDSQ